MSDLKPCRFGKKCIHRESDCFEETYCGMKEQFMTKEEAREYRKKNKIPVKEDRRLKYSRWYQGRDG